MGCMAKLRWRTKRVTVEELERAIYGRRITDRRGIPFDQLGIGVEVLLDLRACGYVREEPGEFWYKVLHVGDQSREWPYLAGDFRARLGGPGDCGAGGIFRLEQIQGIRQPPEWWNAADGSNWRYFPKECRWYGQHPHWGHLKLWVDEYFRVLYPDAPSAVSGW
jgi:hypothetical protein